MKIKKLYVESEKVSKANRDAVQRKLCQEIIIHVNDATLQMIIAQNNRNGFEIWKYLLKKFGQIRLSQIIVLWQVFLELKKNGESIVEFLNKVDNIVIKLQSADEKISDNLKIAIVLEALPHEYGSFIAAIQFQQKSYLQLEERLIERSLGGSSNKQDTSSTSIAALAIHRNGRGRYNGGTGQGNKKTLYCTKCGRNNHTTDRCYAKQHVSKQNSSNRQGGFSGFALTATSNGSMDIEIDCGCTNHIIPDKSMFKTLSILEGDGSAMFITNGDGTQQRVHGVGEVCLPFYDCYKGKYTFNLQLSLYVPSFKFHLISVSLLVKQVNTVIFNQICIYVWDKKNVFFGLNIVQKSPICRHCLLLSGMQGFLMQIVKH